MFTRQFYVIFCIITRNGLFRIEISVFLSSKRSYLPLNVRQTNRFRFSSNISGNNKDKRVKKSINKFPGVPYRLIHEL